MIGWLHSSGANGKWCSSSAILIMFCLNSEWIASVNQGRDFINEHTLVGKINYVNWLTYSDRLWLWPCRRLPEMVFELLIPLLITGEGLIIYFSCLSRSGSVCWSDEKFITWCSGFTDGTWILMKFLKHLMLLSCFKYEITDTKTDMTWVQHVSTYKWAMNMHYHRLYTIYTSLYS